MDSLSTKKLLSTYEQQPPRTRALTGTLRSVPENFHNSESVEKDILRDEENIATVVQSINSSGNKNEATVFTNKEFTPPIFNEEFGVNVFDMQRRAVGQTNFDNPNFRFNAGQELIRTARRVEEKIQRALEEMASQVYQTGVLVLNDQDGVQRFTMNFSPKATHFPTVGTDWTDPAADALGDISNLTDVIRTDGLVEIDRLWFGEAAFQNFIRNTEYRAQLDNRRMFTGEVNPTMRGDGMTFQGFVWVGNYRYEMWTYKGQFKDPQTGLAVRYITTNNVVFTSTTGTVIDLTMGTIPSLFPFDPRLSSFLPSRLGSADRGMRMSVNAWITENNKTIKMEVGTRPLVIPTGIDTFGTLLTIQ